MSTATGDEQDQADMARLAAGHDAALNDLMARHSARVFGYLVRLLGNETEAEDLAQEAFLQLFRKIGTFRGESAFSKIGRAHV